MGGRAHLRRGSLRKPLGHLLGRGIQGGQGERMGEGQGQGQGEWERERENKGERETEKQGESVDFGMSRDEQ